MEIIKIALKIKSPSDEAQNFDFNEKASDVMEAVNDFNEKYRDWSKRIVIVHLAKKSMHMLLIVEKVNIAENISVREIRYFISHLRNKKNWKAYTRELNKMFETVEFTKVGIDEMLAYYHKVKQNDYLYEHQKEDVDFMAEIPDSPNRVPKVSNSPIEMCDEDIVTVIEYLLKTKDKGGRVKQKEADINDIKQILNKWL